MKSQYLERENEKLLGWARDCACVMMKLRTMWVGKGGTTCEIKTQKKVVNTSS